MSYTHKLNSGSLFNNTRKTKDTHPDRSGTINVEGKLYFIDGWLKQDKHGNPWLSLAVKLMDRQPEQTPATAPSKPQGSIKDMDDDIPW